jgi:hypothetical protein
MLMVNLRSNHHEPPKAPRPRTLVDDPVYYLMLGVFALLTVVTPVLLGQSRFLPLAQSAALTAFLALPLRERRVGRALIVLAAWLAFEFAVVFAAAFAVPRGAEAAVGGGFAYRAALLEWLYGAARLPTGWADQPWLRAWELVAATAGSLLTGGFLGYWILVKTTALAAYGAAAVWESGAGISGFLPWQLLRIAGYSGFVVVFAQALWAGMWSPRALWRAHRRTLLISAALLGAALLFEAFLPGLWRGTFAP